MPKSKAAANAPEILDFRSNSSSSDPDLNGRNSDEFYTSDNFR
jgi:hypothetical protein